MDYLTEHYKKKAEQLQEHLNFLHEVANFVSYVTNLTEDTPNINPKLAAAYDRALAWIKENPGKPKAEWPKEHLDALEQTTKMMKGEVVKPSPVSGDMSPLETVNIQGYGENGRPVPDWHDPLDPTPLEAKFKKPTSGSYLKKPLPGVVSRTLQPNMGDVPSIPRFEPRRTYFRSGSMPSDYSNVKKTGWTSLSGEAGGALSMQSAMGGKTPNLSPEKFRSMSDRVDALIKGEHITGSPQASSPSSAAAAGEDGSKIIQDMMNRNRAGFASTPSQEPSGTNDSQRSSSSVPEGQPETPRTSSSTTNNSNRSPSYEEQSQTYRDRAAERLRAETEAEAARQRGPSSPSDDALRKMREQGLNFEDLSQAEQDALRGRGEQLRNQDIGRRAAELRGETARPSATESPRLSAGSGGSPPSGGGPRTGGGGEAPPSGGSTRSTGAGEVAPSGGRGIETPRPTGTNVPMSSLKKVGTRLTGFGAGMVTGGLADAGTKAALRAAGVENEDILDIAGTGVGTGVGAATDIGTIAALSGAGAAGAGAAAAGAILPFTAAGAAGAALGKYVVKPLADIEYKLPGESRAKSTIDRLGDSLYSGALSYTPGGALVRMGTNLMAGNNLWAGSGDLNEKPTGVAGGDPAKNAQFAAEEQAEREEAQRKAKERSDRIAAMAERIRQGQPANPE
jgi:hypothetical protein